MIRRLLATTLVVGALLFSQLSLGGSIAAAEPAVSVSPSAGSQYDTFTFAGSGFTPGSIVQATFTSPDGDDVVFYFAGTQTPYFVTTDDNGDWTFTLQPSTDLEGYRAGTWTAKLCISDGSGCYSGPFSISVQ